MAQRITNVCDECLLADGADTPAQSWAVTITPPGEKAAPYEIDVCEKHGKPLADLATHLADYARRADRKRALPAPSANVAPTSAGFPCPSCDHVAKTKAGLATHSREKHGQTVAEASGRASIACPVRGCKRAFGGFQGVSSHLRSPVHGYPSEKARDAIRAMHPEK